MPDPNAAFVGEIPVNYDRYLGPVFFHGFADDLAGGLPVGPNMRVLEVACGTGIVTRPLLDRIRGHRVLVATDLNEAMIAHGRKHIAAELGDHAVRCPLRAIVFSARRPSEGAA